MKILAWPTQSIVLLSLLALPQLSEAAAARIVTGTDTNSAPHVKAFTTRTLTNTASFFAFTPSFMGGVRVAAGDVNGDGAADIITGSGPGAAQLTAFSGRDQSELHNFLPYGSGYVGGIFVATGDINGDGADDIVTGADEGTTPHVRVFDGLTGEELNSFFPYPAGFSGGVRVAVGDVNNDGQPDIITGAGPGGGPHIKVFDGTSQAELASFFAYDPGFAGGVYVASGDINSDGHADIITGAGPGGGPHVRVFDGNSLSKTNEFFAYDLQFQHGVRVAVGDLDGDGHDEILTAAGPGGAPLIRVFDGTTLVETAKFLAYPVDYTNGVFIAAASLTHPQLEIDLSRAPQEIELQWPSGCLCDLEGTADPTDPQAWEPLDVRPTENGTRIGLLLPAVQKFQFYRLKCDEEAIRAPDPTGF